MHRRAGTAGSIDQYYLFHAARADLLRRLNRCAEAATAYRAAVNLTVNPIELEFLRRRLQQMEERMSADCIS